MTDAQPPPRVRVLVVDDHGIVRDGLTMLLERDARMIVIGSAATGNDAIRFAEQLKPDVVVMDLVLPDLSGVDATERILSLLPQAQVVMLSMCRSSENVFRALRAGARGYVVKESAATELVSAVVAVVAGHRFLSPGISDGLIDDLMRGSHVRSPLETLSAREREVLHLTVAGTSSAAIARRLSLSRKTVDTYRSRLMGKLGVPDLPGLIRFAVEHAITPG